MGVQPLVQPMMFSSAQRITIVNYTYGSATLSAASLCTYRITELQHTYKCPTLTTTYVRAADVGYLYI